MFKKTYSFDDVLLVPQASDIKSRTEIDIGSTLGGHKFVLPIISAPMDTVTDHHMSLALRNQGGMGVVHRYNSIEEQVEIIRQCSEDEPGPWVAAAVGVSGDFEERACALFDAGARVICVDVAHGHHTLVKHALETLRGVFGESIHIMTGNVATLEAFNDLSDWGADSIRVGIGGGSICSTRIMTGHGVPTFQSVLDCAKSDRNAKLIADGGIKTSGDIVKALAAGADFVMLGSMLAGTDETPGAILQKHDGTTYKIYRGMASKEAQYDWRGEARSLEGVSTTVPGRGPVNNILKDLAQNIRSGLSYSGARNIRELQGKSEFIIQSGASQIESGTHIFNVRK